MEKRFVTKILVSTLIIAIFSTSLFAQFQRSRSGQKKRNIEQFYLSAVTKQNDSSDSINVIVYMQIPNYALQFIKKDTMFVANYEATIALQDKKGNQVGRVIWQDSLFINDYIESTSLNKGTSLMADFAVSPGSYRYYGSLYDNDTRNTGEIKEKLNLSKYDDDLFLHNPFLLINQNGYWGFNDNLIPSLSKSANDISNGILMYLSGRIQPGEYTIGSKLTSSSKDVVWEETIVDTSENNWFERYVRVPAEALQDGISFEFSASVIQNGKTSTESSQVSVRRPGVSHLISDIDRALDQMNYILNTQEKASLKRTSKKKREELFREFWESRDPTPGTVHNELMEEYYKRIAYANEHFTGVSGGWKSDMGMIYTLFGAPDDVERTVMSGSRGNNEIWYYYRISRSFIFEDIDGFGHYRLKTPFFGDPF
jgi:GWxTD domain-containing protein